MPALRSGAAGLPPRTALVVALTAAFLVGIAALVVLNFQHAVDDTLVRVGRRNAALSRTVAVGLQVDIEARIAALEQLRALPSIQQIDAVFLRDRLEQGLAGNPRRIRFEILRGTARREVLSWQPGAAGFGTTSLVNGEVWEWAESADHQGRVRAWAHVEPAAVGPHVDIVTPVYDLALSPSVPVASERYTGLLAMRVDLAQLADSLFDPAVDGLVDTSLSIVSGDGSRVIYARPLGASEVGSRASAPGHWLPGSEFREATVARPVGTRLFETPVGRRLVSWAALEVAGLPLVVRCDAPPGVASAGVRSAFLRQLPPFALLSAAVVALAWMFVRRERSEERYHDLVTQAGDSVFVLDRHGVVLEMNAAATGLFAGEMPEAVGRPFASCLAPESAEAWRGVLAQLGPGERASHEWQLVGPSGETMAAEISVSRGASGNVLAIARDISRRQALENQLRQSQKMEAVGRLAGGVAHDFNNLLTAIIGYNDLLIDRMASDDPGLGDALEIRKSAQRAAMLTRQLLAFGRKQVLRPRVIDVNHVVTELDGLLWRLLGELVQLTFEPDPGVWPVEADPHQLEQVVVNLALNARDAMPGGGRLTIATGNVALDAAEAADLSLQPGDYVALSVHDTGHGIDERSQKLLFEPFYTTRPLGKGTGLGLPMVHGIVSQSGGSIQVVSKPGAGATFRVFLPRSRKPLTASVLTPRPPSHVGGSEVVLLVEDDQAVRSLAKEALTRRGYVVIESALPEDAIAAAARERVIDAVLTDVVMPQMTGPALVEQVRRTRPAVPVLFMSGYPDAMLRKSGAMPAGSAFVAKPFTAEGLALALRRLLDRQRS